MSTHTTDNRGSTSQTGKTELFEKYDVPAPRYTSYPTVPYWTDNPSGDQWVESLKASLNTAQNSWSLYCHIPFCEQLCTFCGCNTSITRDHGREKPYIDLLHKEWSMYLEKVPAFQERELRQIHLGGGSPNFLSPTNLSYLIEKFKKDCRLAPNFEGSAEMNPRLTSKEQLKQLMDLGFKRISFGIQDFDLEVQKAINRIQPFEMDKELTEYARSIGFESVNFDLVYGLPMQTPQTAQRMAELTLQLRPDRIALYSFALVPWVKKAHNLFAEENLPSGADKRKLYEICRTTFLENGYIEIGMDHFALPTDALSIAEKNKTLHRNFMGYTEHRTDVLLGLGVSSISDASTCFHQNEKQFPVYERRVTNGEIPTMRGHLLTPEDRKRREQILTLMTTWQTELDNDAHAEDVKNYLAPLIDDQLCQIQGNKIVVPPAGKPFLRNICMSLDARLRKSAPDKKVFSQSV